jgi:hypothetical protein
VAAVAGADHDGFPAGELPAADVGARVGHRPGELLDTRDFRHVRDAAHARGQHDMVRLQGPLGAVVASDPHRPLAGVVVVVAAEEVRPGPHVDLHGGHIRLEPVGQLVLGGEHRPVGRERQVGHVVVPDRVVEHQ